MKGRRKIKTSKWKLQAQFIQEAKSILESESYACRSGRFLSKAVAAGRDVEPVGLLAGPTEKCGEQSLVNALKRCDRFSG